MPPREFSGTIQSIGPNAWRRRFWPNADSASALTARVNWSLARSNAAARARSASLRWGCQTPINERRVGRSITFGTPFAIKTFLERVGLRMGAPSAGPCLSGAWVSGSPSWVSGTPGCLDLLRGCLELLLVGRIVSSLMQNNLRRCRICAWYFRLNRTKTAALIQLSTCRFE
jgi:hypothetical protein